MFVLPKQCRDYEHHLFYLRPGIPQRNSPIEYELSWLRIVIHTKISEPLELEAILRLRSCKASLHFTAFHDFKRIWIYVFFPSLTGRIRYS